MKKFFVFTILAIVTMGLTSPSLVSAQAKMISKKSIGPVKSSLALEQVEKSETITNNLIQQKIDSSEVNTMSKQMDSIFMILQKISQDLEVDVSLENQTYLAAKKGKGQCKKCLKACKGLGPEGALKCMSKCSEDGGPCDHSDDGENDSVDGASGGSDLPQTQPAF